MKVLYMPGLASITDKDFDIANSCKFKHLAEISDCTVFDYRKYRRADILKYVANFDVLFGSSFGGYFTFFLGLITGKPSIVVNPSLYLDERIGSLIQENPRELSFINPVELKALRTEPTGEPSPHIHVLMNIDDEVLDAGRILSIAEEFQTSMYVFEKGGHQSVNFQGDMLPTVKMIFSNIKM